MTEVTYNQLATIKEEPYELALHCAYATVLESLELDEEDVLVTIEEKNDRDHVPYAKFTVDLGNDMIESGEMRQDQMGYTVLVLRNVPNDSANCTTVVDLESKYVYYYG